MNSTKVRVDGKENNISFLVEILVEILSRLPTSTLIRFKSVCKLWFSLINDDPVIAKLHFDRGYKSTCPSIIVFSEDHGLILLNDEGGHKYLVCSTEEPPRDISPSCNGVLCIYGKATTALLINPTTREELALPKPSDVRLLSEFFVGYLPETNKYKVLRFFDLPTQCEILTVGTSSWRQITINRIASAWVINLINGGVSINGFMYWTARSGGANTLEILSLDLNLERFGTIKFPEFLSYGDLLLEVGGRLCVTLARVGSMEIWILENITSQAWVQRYNLRISCLFGQPIFIHQENLLFRSYDGLHYLDIKTGRENLGTPFDVKNWYLHHAQVHIESLVRLKAL